jgi:hypothetical protein
MFAFYLNNKNQNQARIIRTLYRSCPYEKTLNATVRFEDNTKINSKAKVIVFAGMIRGEGLIYKYCQASGRSFIYVDHAYFNRGYDSGSTESEWMRVTQNLFSWSKFQPETPDRWKQHFDSQHKLAPWNTHEGKNILVLPPSEATKYLFPESVEWTESTVKELKKYVNAPVRIREKPYQPVIDPVTNQVINRLSFDHNTKIDDELMNAKYVVAFNSAVPVQATLLGIPCIASPISAAYPISLTMDRIKYPPEPNRQEWLNQLVHHQFTTAEMKSGDIWTMLEKYANVR